MDSDFNLSINKQFEFAKWPWNLQNAVSSNIVPPGR